MMLPRIISQGLVTILCCFFIGLDSSADEQAGLLDRSFVKPYDQGVDALTRGEWREAEELMRQAISIRSEEARRIRQVLFFRPYLPHYYLGVALFNQGDCQGALEAWNESVRQGHVSGLDQMKEVRDGRQECAEQESLKNQVTDLTSRVSRDQEAASEILASIGKMLEELEIEFSSVAGDHLLQQDYEALVERVEDLEIESDKVLTESGQSLEWLQEAASSWSEVVDTARSLRARVLTLAEELGEQQAAVRLAQEEEELEKARAQRKRLARGARSALSKLPPSSSLPPQVQERADQTRRVLSSLRQDETDLETLLEEVRALRATLNNLRAVATPPPQELSEAVRLFLDGRHQEVLERLEVIPFDAPEAKAHGLLLRAGARYLEGRRNQGSLADDDLRLVEEDIEAAISLSPQLKTWSTVYPPSFIKLFDQARERQQIDDQK